MSSYLYVIYKLSTIFNMSLYFCNCNFTLLLWGQSVVNIFKIIIIINQASCLLCHCWLFKLILFLLNILEIDGVIESQKRVDCIRFRPDRFIFFKKLDPKFTSHCSNYFILTFCPYFTLTNLTNVILRALWG